MTENRPSKQSPFIDRLLMEGLGAIGMGLLLSALLAAIEEQLGDDDAH